MPLSPPVRASLARSWRWLLPVVAFVLAFHFLPFGPTLDRAFLDLAARHPLRAPPLPGSSALVLVDQATMDLLGREPYAMHWPFPRNAFSALIMALDRAGARRIVLDFTFFEQADAAEQDLLLAGTAAVIPSVVLARTRDEVPVFWGEDFQRDHPQYFDHPRMGFTEFLPDSDGVARRYEPAGSLATAALGAAAPPARGLLRWHGGISQLRALGVPVLSAGQYIRDGLPILARVSERAPDLDPAAIARALALEPPKTGPLADAVRGRTVFVGVNVSGTFDVKPMPVGRLEPGVLILWTAWSNLATTGFTTPVPRALALAAGALALLAVVGAGMGRPGLGAPGWTSLGLVAGVIAAAYAALSFGWFFPPATPVAAALATLLGVTADRFWAEAARKREIQAMFGSYVDPAVVALLVRDPAAIRLGGERREATVYFCDLAGFTDLSEKVSSEELLAIINAYLDDMSNCLIDYGAYIDKYIGDAVMAVFGVPLPLADHAGAACAGALAAQGVLRRLNERLARTGGPELRMRIGLNSGPMIVGNLGSERKKNYTVLGDAVNLASRLEGANKEFGTEILLGETTARLVAGRFATRPLTRLRVKGKHEAVEVHTLLGAHADLTEPQRGFLKAYLAGYADFGARRFAAAGAALEQALALAPGDLVTTSLLRQAADFAKNPPPSDWEPILKLETK